MLVIRVFTVRWLATIVALATALGQAGAVTALAAPTASLDASFSPYRLGASTTLAFGLSVGAQNGQVPAALTGMQLRLPAGLGLFTSTLGETVCQPATLQAQGIAGCPANSLVGRGHAIVRIPLGSEQLDVPVKIAILMGPLQDHHTGLFLYAEAESSVIAEMIFPGTVLGGSYPFGTLIDTTIPPITGLPGAPAAAVVQMHATIGPEGVVYARMVNGKTVKFHPTGMTVPETCPRAGFPFEVTLHFQDGTAATAHTAVACPASSRHRAREAKGPVVGG